MKHTYHCPEMCATRLTAELPVSQSYIPKGEGSGGNTPEVKGDGGVFEQTSDLDSPFWE